MTRNLKKASYILDINLLDHVVLGTPNADPDGLGYYSFAEAGVLE